ncbi:MAG: PQQ-dependent sugar dehydrogenase [Bacteroidota bacterium]
MITISKIGYLKIWWIFILLWKSFWMSSQSLPEGFIDQMVQLHPTAATGISFDDRGRMYVMEKRGQISLYQEGRRLPDPFVDLREEVGNWRDHGLLGFALHPNFENNGYIYLLYAVDRYHLLHATDPNYQPDSSKAFCASIGRLTRYTADPATDFQTVLPDSRKVLIGNSVVDGFPLVHQSHGVGSIVFGTDGTLMVSCGDGASYTEVDIGQNQDTSTYALQALDDGILTAEENVGAFRAQLLHSLNGKVLRIDPETGAGIPSNPFYDESQPYSPASRVWALGLRNPFRMALLPESGVHDPQQGDPGTLFIGDVGWYNWEELNILTQGGQNMGWPLFEGVDRMWPYYSRRTPNFTLPLGNIQNCGDAYFSYQDLILQQTRDRSSFYSAPCGIATEHMTQLPRFTHLPPALKWSNKWNENFGSYVPGFNDLGELEGKQIGSPQSTVKGKPFGGGSSTGGAFYAGRQFPDAYHDTYFHADFSGKWIKALHLNAAGELEEVEDFYGLAGEVVSMAYNPTDECLYYLRYPRQIRKICFGSEPVPIAKISVDTIYGNSPLKVQFSAENSLDPTDGKLLYRWDFGDGAHSHSSSPTHVYTSSLSGPQRYTATLTIQNELGERASTDTSIFLNNTPPMVRISSIEDSSFYGMSAAYYLPLEAEVEDREYANSELTYVWETFFHHNSHYHPEEPDSQATTQAFITPAGCEDEAYWYRFRLTVMDPDGLSSEDEVVLFPDCGPPPVQFTSVDVQALRENKVQLSWKRTDAVSNEYFEVERSVDGGKTYEVLGMLSDTNPSEQRIASFTFLDATPLWGFNQYRIKAVNRFGTFVYSPVRGITFPKSLTYSLYPNPSKGEISLDVLVGQGLRTQFRLIDLTGRTIYTHSWIPEWGKPQTLNLRLVSPGLYMYEWENTVEKGGGKLLINREE